MTHIKLFILFQIRTVNAGSIVSSEKGRLNRQNGMQNLKHEAVEKEFDINLSALTFSEKFVNFNGLNYVSHIMNKECKSGESVIHTTEENAEMYLPSYSNEERKVDILE